MVKMVEVVLEKERNKPLDNITCDSLKEQFEEVNEACSNEDDNIKNVCWNMFVTSDEDKGILEKCEISLNSGHMFSDNELLISVLLFLSWAYV